MYLNVEHFANFPAKNHVYIYVNNLPAKDVLRHANMTQ